MQKPILTTAAAVIALAAVTATPAQARYLQTDPIGYEDNVNLYVYVHNDPLNQIDPNGEDAILVREPDGSRTVIVPVNLTGSMVTATTGAELQSIAAGWQVDGGVDNFQIVITSTPMEGVLNTVEIGSGPRPRGQIPCGHDRSGNRQIKEGGRRTCLRIFEDERR